MNYPYIVVHIFCYYSFNASIECSCLGLQDKEDRGEGQKRKARGKWAGASLSKVDAVPCLIIDNVLIFVFF